MRVSDSKRRKLSILPLSRRLRRAAGAMVVVVLLALVLVDRLGCQTSRLEGDRGRYHDKTFRVAQVVDGDTLDLEMADITAGKATTRVRLWGVDSPETAYAPAGEMHYGKQATELARRLASGQQVRIRLEPYEHTRCKYGRLLAYVYLPDGTMLNEELLRQGAAYADERFEHIYMQRFNDLQKQAKRQKQGLWRDVRPEQTPQWYQERHNKK